MQSITFIKTRSIYKKKIDIYSVYDLKNYIKSCKRTKLSYKQTINNVTIYTYHVTHTEYKTLKDLGFCESNECFNDYFGFK